MFLWEMKSMHNSKAIWHITGILELQKRFTALKKRTFYSFENVENYRMLMTILMTCIIFVIYYNSLSLQSSCFAGSTGNKAISYCFWSNQRTYTSRPGIGGKADQQVKQFFNGLEHVFRMGQEKLRVNTMQQKVTLEWQERAAFYHRLQLFRRLSTILSRPVIEASSGAACRHVLINVNQCVNEYFTFVGFRAIKKAGYSENHSVYIIRSQEVVFKKEERSAPGEFHKVFCAIVE